jgi:hypothetical protein
MSSWPSARSRDQGATRDQALQWPLPDGALRIVAIGEKKTRGAGGPDGSSNRGESRQELHFQFSFVSFGANIQCFRHACLRHLAGDTQIGLMGFHQKPLCDGTKCPLSTAAFA